MVRKKPNPEDAARAYFVGLTPNQVVAYNLAMARDQKGWTQDQAAEALEPYLGVRWSKASFSQAERSVAGAFVRNFTADEIVAFARAFDLPVTWFFMPPPPLADAGVATRLAVPDAARLGENVALLVDLVFGDAHQQGRLSMRLDAFLAATAPGSLTAPQERIAALVNERITALVRRAFAGLGEWQNSLRSLANQLEDLEARSKRIVAGQLGIDVDDLAMPVPPEDWTESQGGSGAAPAATVEAGRLASPAEAPNVRPARRSRTSSPATSTGKRKA